MWVSRGLGWHFADRLEVSGFTLMHFVAVADGVSVGRGGSPSHSTNHQSWSAVHPARVCSHGPTQNLGFPFASWTLSATTSLSAGSVASVRPEGGDTSLAIPRRVSAQSAWHTEASNVFTFEPSESVMLRSSSESLW